MRKRRIYTVLTLLWIIIIFSFSLQPADTSRNMSAGVGHWLVELLPTAFVQKMSTMPQEQLEFLHFLLRKAGHFSEYFVLGILSMLTLSRTELKYKKFCGVVFCVLVASVDETIQLFVSGRSGQISDVVLDGFGAMCGIAMIFLLNHFTQFYEELRN